MYSFSWHRCSNASAFFRYTRACIFFRKCSRDSYAALHSNGASSFTVTDFNLASKLMHTKIRASPNTFCVPCAAFFSRFIFICVKCAASQIFFKEKKAILIRLPKSVCNNVQSNHVKCVLYEWLRWLLFEKFRPLIISTGVSHGKAMQANNATKEIYYFSLQKKAN